MSRARCYECSACGGLVRETARACPYCQSPVATVRCARCFTMSVPEALHCISCGTELGLMPLPVPASGSLKCPRCPGLVLDGFDNGETTLHDCKGCGGQFIASDELSKMIEQHEARRIELPKKLRKHNPLDQSVTYLPCPACKELMTRKNFGGMSGVIVDVCSKHGTWFDVGELPRILAFVGSGGLQVSKAKALEQQRQQAAQVKLPDTHMRSTSSSHAFLGSGTSSSVDGFDDFEESVMAFVRWARRYLL